MATEYDPQYMGIGWTVDSSWVLMALVTDSTGALALRHLGLITNINYTASYQVGKGDKKCHAFKFKARKGSFAMEPDEYVGFPAEVDPELERINPWMDEAMADADQPLSNKCSTYYTYAYYSYLLFYARPSTDRTHTGTHHTLHYPQPQTRSRSC
jgi:hypothetical protein